MELEYKREQMSERSEFLLFDLIQIQKEILTELRSINTNIKISTEKGTEVVKEKEKEIKPKAVKKTTAGKKAAK
jgi:hypothetical protein